MYRKGADANTAYRGGRDAKQRHTHAHIQRTGWGVAGPGLGGTHPARLEIYTNINYEPTRDYLSHHNATRTPIRFFLFPLYRATSLNFISYIVKLTEYFKN